MYIMYQCTTSVCIRTEAEVSNIRRIKNIVQIPGIILSMCSAS